MRAMRPACVSQTKLNHRHKRYDSHDESDDKSKKEHCPTVHDTTSLAINQKNRMGFLHFEAVDGAVGGFFAA